MDDDVLIEGEDAVALLQASRDWVGIIALM
jgi:hypothetical protein